MGVRTGLMTFLEFEKLPDPPSGHLELQHGQAVLGPPPKKTHVKTRQQLLYLLRPLEDLGFLAAELPFRAAPEYEFWVCDTGLISQLRWDADENEYFAGAPDLVIEVLSFSNTMDEMLERQEICLKNGCRSFWVVDRKRQTVMVTGHDRVTLPILRGIQCLCPHLGQGPSKSARSFSCDDKVKASPAAAQGSKG